MPPRELLIGQNLKTRMLHLRIQFILAVLIFPSGFSLLGPAIPSPLLSEQNRYYLPSIFSIYEASPPAVQFLQSNYFAFENDPTITLPVSISHSSDQEIRVEYAVLPGTAAAGEDYSTQDGTLIFSPGQTSRSLVVNLLDDPMDELDEAVTILLRNPTQAVLGNIGTIELSIIDDEAPLTIALDRSDDTVVESAAFRQVEIVLSRPSTRVVQVSYATEDGSARAGQDYVAAAGVLSFEPGQTRQGFNIPILDNPMDGPNKILTVRLSDPVGGMLGSPALSTLLIFDDDGPVTVQFNRTAITVSEMTSLVTLTVSLNSPAEQVIAVRYATLEGTAQAESDYRAVEGTLTFSPGQTRLPIQVPVLNDLMDEADETVQVRLSDPMQADLGTPAACTLVISDNKKPGSPFSLQIAALHQIQPGRPALSDSGNGSLSAQLDTEQPAWLEAAYPALIEALQESGASGTRVYLSWSQLQPAAPETGRPPQFSTSALAWYDNRLGMIANAGIQILATVASAPAWAAASPCSAVYAEQLDAYAQFLTDLVRHYQVSPYNIRRWEIANEPDGTWANDQVVGLGCMGHQGAEYARMLAVAYSAIKTADPTATVLMGGVAHDWFVEYDGPFYRYFPDRIMEAGAGQFVDALNFHYFPEYHAEWERWDPASQDRIMGWLPAPTCGDLYDGVETAYEAGGKDLIAKTSHFRNRMQTCYGVQKPIWVTELAEHGYAYHSASLMQQARYVIQGYVRGLAAGVANITWYALTTVNDNYQQGLLFDNLTPKPAFYAYQTLTSELNGYEYTGTLGQADLEGYVFQEAAGQVKTVVWGSGSLSFLARQIRLVEYQGNATLIEDGGSGDIDGLKNGSIQLQLGLNPIFIQSLP